MVKTNLYIRFSAFMLLILMMASSINLHIITHQCNYSKKKSIHFFSFNHKCKKTKCAFPEKKSSEERVSKIPCCDVETLVVDVQDFASTQKNITTSQYIILSSLFSFVLPQKTIEKNNLEYPEPEPIHFGYQYRIEMQSFLC